MYFDFDFFFKYLLNLFWYKNNTILEMYLEKEYSFEFWIKIVYFNSF